MTEVVRRPGLLLCRVGIGRLDAYQDRQLLSNALEQRRLEGGDEDGRVVCVGHLVSSCPDGIAGVWETRYEVTGSRYAPDGAGLNHVAGFHGERERSHPARHSAAARSNSFATFSRSALGSITLQSPAYFMMSMISSRSSA